MDVSIYDKYQIKPVFDNNYQTIVFATDNNFFKYFLVTMQSLIANSSSGVNYDIVVFENDVSEYLKDVLTYNLPENFSVRYFNPDEVIKSLVNTDKLATNHLTIQTYYRLFIPMVMKNYERVLYADVDLIFNKPIDELFTIDLGDKEMGATLDEVAYFQNLEFCKNRTMNLGLTNPCGYFNAGVLVFNTKIINLQTYIANLLNAFEHPKLEFLDQDILNLMYNDKIYILDAKWNYYYHVHLTRTVENVKSLPKEYNDRNFRELCIIHYTGDMKPWNFPEYYLAHLWWAHARNTSFYEVFIKLMQPKIMVVPADGVK